MLNYIILFIKLKKIMSFFKKLLKINNNKKNLIFFFLYLFIKLILKKNEISV